MLIVCSVACLFLLGSLVPVQVIDWKDSDSKMTYNVLMGTLNPAHTHSHSLT